LNPDLMSHESEFEVRPRVEAAPAPPPQMRLGGVAAEPPAPAASAGNGTAAAPPAGNGAASAVPAADVPGTPAASPGIGAPGTKRRRRRRGRRRGRGKQAAAALGEAFAALAAGTSLAVRSDAADVAERIPEVAAPIVTAAEEEEAAAEGAEREIGVN